LTKHNVSCQRKNGGVLLLFNQDFLDTSNLVSGTRCCQKVLIPSTSLFRLQHPKLAVSNPNPASPHYPPPPAAAPPSRNSHSDSKTYTGSNVPQPGSGSVTRDLGSRDVTASVKRSCLSREYESRGRRENGREIAFAGPLAVRCWVRDARFRRKTLLCV